MPSCTITSRTRHVFTIHECLTSPNLQARLRTSTSTLELTTLSCYLSSPYSCDDNVPQLLSLSVYFPVTCAALANLSLKLAAIFTICFICTTVQRERRRTLRPFKPSASHPCLVLPLGRAVSFGFHKIGGLYKMRNKLLA